MIGYNTLIQVVQHAKANKERTSIIAGIATIVLLLLWVVYLCLFPVYVPNGQWLEPNQVGFLIPKSAPDQNSQMNTKGYAITESSLESMKINGPYAEIPQRKVAIGRITYHWEPSAKLLIVNRAPVTQEWGTQSIPAKSNLGFILSSEEGVEFKVGASITTSIPEKGAAKFLVNFLGSNLSDATATRVHGYIQGALNEAFRKMSLERTISNSPAILNEVRSKTIKYFAEKGIEISDLQFGSGLIMIDQVYQRVINETVKAKLDVALLQEKVKAQELKDLLEQKNKIDTVLKKDKKNADR